MNCVQLQGWLHPRPDHVPHPQPRRPGGGGEAEDHDGVGGGEPGGGGGGLAGGEGELQSAAAVCQWGGEAATQPVLVAGRHQAGPELCTELLHLQWRPDWAGAGSALCWPEPDQQAAHLRVLQHRPGAPQPRLAPAGAPPRPGQTGGGEGGGGAGAGPGPGGGNHPHLHSQGGQAATNNNLGRQTYPQSGGTQISGGQGGGGGGAEEFIGFFYTFTVCNSNLSQTFCLVLMWQ